MHLRTQFLVRLAAGALAGLAAVGCTNTGGPPGAPPQPSPDRTYSRDAPLLPAEPLSAEQAKAVLLGYFSAGYKEAALQWTTGTEREYMQAVLAQWQAGTPGQVRQWTVSPESTVVVRESNALAAVAVLTYVSTASGREESVLFRFERSDGQWLVSGHSDPAGRWWPDGE